ncbi:hypothetical protein G6F50_014108 [Rhizopus delemar]|uniref:Uncharacterized protein n=1 Tax=Rhizopus delemar TaxID=936053 RepID=A0A9P6Y9N2_9FUNG|nr:hypothetical protein G6F50_014108 [Rhizopus delemar]
MARHGLLQRAADGSTIVGVGQAHRGEVRQPVGQQRLPAIGEFLHVAFLERGARVQQPLQVAGDGFLVLLQRDGLEDRPGARLLGGVVEQFFQQAGFESLHWSIHSGSASVRAAAVHQRQGRSWPCPAIRLRWRTRRHRSDTASHGVVRDVLGCTPLRDGLATNSAFRLLLLVSPLDGAEAQLNNFLGHAFLVHRGGDAVDQHVQQLDRVVIDRVAVLVGAHELELRLREGGAVGGGLGEGRGGEVDRLGDFDRGQVHAGCGPARTTGFRSSPCACRRATRP